jgi:uncharacterized membrane protein YeaQ/YmgE (transglycosylase-associated protein family)
MGMGILTWIVVGVVTGGLAGQFLRGGNGSVGDLLLGIVGALTGGVGGALILGRDVRLTAFSLESVVLAFLGAVALIAISRMLSGRRVRA